MKNCIIPIAAIKGVIKDFEETINGDVLLTQDQIHCLKNQVCEYIYKLLTLYYIVIWNGMS